MFVEYKGLLILCIVNSITADDLWPCLLIRFNFNLRMDK